MFAILLMLFYIIPAIGVNVSSHFCAGDQVIVPSCSKEEKNCSCGAKIMKKGCCEEKRQILKIDDTQQKAELISQKFSNPFHAVISIPAAFAQVVFIKNIRTIIAQFLSALNFNRQPIYLLNRVFRI